MRRLCSIALWAELLVVLSAGSLRGADGNAMLGANGEVYRVQSGTYKQLFPNPPGSQAGNTVLALDIAQDGKQRRVLVPGTEGAEVEQSPALTVDRSSNRVYLVWEGRQGYHSTLNLLPYSAGDGFGDTFEFCGDAFSTKFNPQLAATIDRYQMIAEDGSLVAASRTILHLIWYDDGALGERVLYTPLVIHDGDVLLSNRIFDASELATGTPASGAASSTASPALLKKPQIRANRDGSGVVAAFIDPGSGALVTTQLRSVAGELVSYADKARAVIIDVGRNRNLSRAQIADAARKVIVEAGRRLLRNELAEFLTDTFLASVRSSDIGEELALSADKARAVIIDVGASLRRDAADRSQAKVVEIAESDDEHGSAQLLEVRNGGSRALPPLPNGEVRILVSQKGDQVALAWSDSAVRYRESTGDGWSPERTVTLGPNLSRDDAFELVDQRISH
ncbi:MAG TPA: hypothetical protein VGV61_01975 [Thermoanaerobaculia bacterium]|jgi:hypothetical protein|nr:hypothetical protein [Thermoanaerobaculia bacterium]